MTFPTTKEGKLAAMELMRAKAPELMDEIAALRAQWGGHLVEFRAPGVRYRTEPEDQNVHTFTRAWADNLRSKPPSPQVLESQRKEKLRVQRAKAKRSKK